MKVVIDIDEDYYEIIKHDVNNGMDYLPCVLIANGTPLPKGHGRLIDADELIQDIKDDSQLYYFNSKSERIIHDEMVDFAIDRIADAITIIPTKEESEEE